MQTFYITTLLCVSQMFAVNILKISNSPLDKVKEQNKDYKHLHRSDLFMSLIVPFPACTQQFGHAEKFSARCPDLVTPIFSQRRLSPTLILSSLSLKLIINIFEASLALSVSGLGSSSICVELAKMSVWVFRRCYRKPEQTFWPINNSSAFSTVIPT